MEYQYIIVKTGNDHVGEIMLNRPKQCNTFDTVIVEAVEEAAGV